MPTLPVHDACKRCGDTLEGVVRHLGLCGRCMATPAKPRTIPQARYGWQQGRDGSRESGDGSREEAVTWPKR